MGCGTSSMPIYPFKMDDPYSERILDNQTNEFKLIIINGEDNRSAILIRQMEMVGEVGYTIKTCKNYTEIVYSFTIQSLKGVLTAMYKLQLDFAGKSRINDGTTFSKLTNLVYTISGETRFGELLVTLMNRFWINGGVQVCFSRSSEWKMKDSISYLIDNIESIVGSDYIATQQDGMKLGSAFECFSKLPPYYLMILY